METSPHSLLVTLWFGILGLMLACYVVTDGFDLGIGILSLFAPERSTRDAMVTSIAHVWDANETWLVVLGGGLFGAFPAAYALLLPHLYVPLMALIAGLIMRGAAIEFRHAAGHSVLWDRVFGVGSLVAAVAQGVILGRLITGLNPGAWNAVFTLFAAIGVAAGYALLGATYLIKKTSYPVESAARGWALWMLPVTVVSALVLSYATLHLSLIGTERWHEHGVLAILLALGVVAAGAVAWLAGSTWTGSRRAPFRAAVLLFLVSFGGLAISLFPNVVPGKLSLMAAASDDKTLVFMLIGIGLLLPVMLGYNLYQYHVFRGKVAA
ncbi:cytochrome d ubiquinol oxidase subunit II [Cupriavidus agavae]|uniref:Cytochrome bd-I ubiquinol oxidase subunit 2 apoprotein n=1 Tax=Cupriavidus agavae TaxID=1001822 RepID=A0A4Q7S083_9BURK|nr:cytochrome d ubiquinol oxidase subunit II [Cupriavidus agavae]RZT39515.1 cytochrome bd-I ubiquinol oxidase subunit 2 apoprotein [Cupriavidus agavae]